MEIHIARDGKQFGPFTLEEVQRQLANGQLSPGDLAWVQGARDWVPLASFAPLQSTQAPPPGGTVSSVHNPNFPPPPMGYVAPQRSAQTSGAAIASLVIGIISFLFCPLIGSIAAVVCGHVARSNIRNSRGTLSGDGLAVAGLVMGYLGFAYLLFIIPVLAGIALPVFSEVQLRGKETQSLANAKQIATACIVYAKDHDDRFPQKLDDLIPEYLPDRTLFASPLSPGEPLAYEYFGGKRTDPPNQVLLMSIFEDRRGKRIILHVDGSGLIGIPPPNLPEPLPQ